MGRRRHDAVLVVDAFPTLWHYDVLRALDYLRAADLPADVRMKEAIAALLDRRREDGRWLLDVRYRDTLHAELSGAVGAPNRWITLRAVRVLDPYAPGDSGDEVPTRTT